MVELAAARTTGVLEPGTAGDWRIERFTATAADLAGQAEALRSTGRFVPPGTYTRLVHRGRVVMSDTPDELADLRPLLRRAHGRVLVNGLGLGCAVRGLLANPAVDHVDVVEREPDVIALVGGAVAGARCTVHRGDAFTFPWPPGERWDAAWHDIWPDLRLANLAEMAMLECRFRDRCAWQGSWGKAYLVRALAARLGEAGGRQRAPVAACPPAVA